MASVDTSNTAPASCYAASPIAIGATDRVLNLFIGELKSFGQLQSAYVKEPVAEQSIAITKDGFPADQHGKVCESTLPLCCSGC
jgi:hypothetical protein